MRPLSDTIARLSRLNRRPPFPSDALPTRLSDLANFGSNPGALSAKFYAPSEPPKSPALAVVLHGCTQTAAGYDGCAGWSKLAEEYGFYVLFPQQRRENNANLCFNWFEKGDTVRDHGEAMSIRQMIETLAAKWKIDRKRIFITGLSAGGAMANVMLATYPEVFAGGAIIAGLPYGVASTVPEAFDRMRGHGVPDRNKLQNLLRGAAPTLTTWPSISVWHGTADQTVSAVNATAIVDQWRGAHGVEGYPPTVTKDEDMVRQDWHNESGQVVLSYHSIDGMGHGTPVDASNDRENSGPFMLDVGLSSTSKIAADWGLTPSFERRPQSTQAQTAHLAPPIAPNLSSGIKQTIENALRAAGLMK